MRPRVLQIGLVAVSLAVGAWFLSGIGEAEESRAKAKQFERTRRARYEDRFENIRIGMTPPELELVFGWPGTVATGGGWPRTINDVPDLLELLREREPWRIQPDEPLHWVVWRLDGQVKYIAVGCVKRGEKLLVVARMYGLADVAEPARIP